MIHKIDPGFAATLLLDRSFIIDAGKMLSVFDLGHWNSTFGLIMEKLNHDD